MKKNTLISNSLILLITALVTGLLSFFNVFQKLDYRLSDFLLHFKKEIPIDKSIVLLKIDDDSIYNLGEFPWTRDIYADALIRLKEMNAGCAVFDIEYLSPSKLGISPTAKSTISNSIDDTMNYIQDNFSDISNAIQKGYIKLNEFSDLSQELLNIVDDRFYELKEYLANNISRDNDEYFGQAIQFFGNTYLTINTQDIGLYNNNEDEIKYVKDRFLFDKIEDNKFRINLDNRFTSKEANEEAGFVPAMHSLISKAKGAGFTNSVVDNDGTRRRMQLLTAYENKYIGQLIFAPLLDRLDTHDITRTNKYYIIHNALLPNSERRQDIKIPLDNHGRILINWLHRGMDETFSSVSVFNLLELDNFENTIITCLNNISQMAILNSDATEMEYTTFSYELLDLYNEILTLKSEMLAKCTGYDNNSVPYDGIKDEEYDYYYGLRNDFFDNLKVFLENDYLPSIKNRLDELKNIIEQTYLDEYYENLESDFYELQNSYDVYTSSFKKLKDILNNSFCIVGNTATSTTDTGATPFVKKYENVCIHATLLNTILQQKFIYHLDWYWSYLIAVLISCILLLFTNKSQIFQNILSGTVRLIYIIFMAVLFVLFNIYTPFVGTLLFIGFEYLISVIFRFLLSSREKQFITHAFSTYMSPDIVKDLIQHPEKLKLGGDKKHITALFSDVKSFSTFSEANTPEELIMILNEYLSDLSDRIIENGGTIDKYEGDAIISFFGAPNEYKDNAFRACLAAIRMKQIESEFNKRHKDEFIKKSETNSKVPKELNSRIGINTGDMVVGNMGTQVKMNYTMLGDAVNLASRLEGVNKVYKTWILCSEDTWKEADSNEHKGVLYARPLDRVRVVGKDTPVQLYNVIGVKSEIPQIQLEELSIFNEAMEKYNSRNYVDAGKLFVKAFELFPDETAEYYANRCHDFIKNGIPDDWDGIVNLTAK